MGYVGKHLGDWWLRETQDICLQPLWSQEAKERWGSEQYEFANAASSQLLLAEGGVAEDFYAHTKILTWLIRQVRRQSDNLYLVEFF